MTRPTAASPRGRERTIGRTGTARLRREHGRHAPQIDFANPHAPRSLGPQLCRTAKPRLPSLTFHSAFAAFRSRNHNEKDLLGTRAGRCFAQQQRMEPRVLPVDRRERPDSVQQERAARQQELQRSYGHAKARRPTRSECHGAQLGARYNGRLPSSRHCRTSRRSSELRPSRATPASSPTPRWWAGSRNVS